MNLNIFIHVISFFRYINTTIKRLYNNQFVSAKVPLYSLEEEKKIVNILERFDKLINDITVGLPAEIELRRKQYEYYRNKL